MTTQSTSARNQERFCAQCASACTRTHQAPLSAGPSWPTRATQLPGASFIALRLQRARPLCARASAAESGLAKAAPAYAARGACGGMLATCTAVSSVTSSPAPYNVRSHPCLCSRCISHLFKRADGHISGNHAFSVAQPCEGRGANQLVSDLTLVHACRLGRCKSPLCRLASVYPAQSNVRRQCSRARLRDAAHGSSTARPA